jgi:hypothetical protein
MKVEGRIPNREQQGLAVNLGVAAGNVKLALPKQAWNASRRINGLAIVIGCLRSPSATRLSGQFGPRLNGFASLPHDRFAFIGAITLKEL